MLLKKKRNEARDFFFVRHSISLAFATLLYLAYVFARWTATHCQCLEAKWALVFVNTNEWTQFSMNTRTSNTNINIGHRSFLLPNFSRKEEKHITSYHATHLLCIQNNTTVYLKNLYIPRNLLYCTTTSVYCKTNSPMKCCYTNDFML